MGNEVTGQFQMPCDEALDPRTVPNPEGKPSLHHGWRWDAALSNRPPILLDNYRSVVGAANDKARQKRLLPSALSFGMLPRLVGDQLGTVPPSE